MRLRSSPDEKTLYIANADNNNVAIVDVGKRGRSKVEGLHPDGLVSDLGAGKPRWPADLRRQRQRRGFGSQSRKGRSPDRAA